MSDCDDLSIIIIDDTTPKGELPGLSNPAFDERKCRNVLVRYCAHIPRNFQYRDGIQQVFLILREHLGDEHMELAGGVLYELIEVDCDYSDDPGAAFQRWRHDHMIRHTNLELPHIPHMTTITPSIQPTSRLIRWRATHPERYQVRLSDHSIASQRASAEPSCIKSRKAWLIEHTMYVSSRGRGTKPFRSPNPQQFHEMQWNMGQESRGRLVDERKIFIDPPTPARHEAGRSSTPEMDVKTDQCNRTRFFPCHFVFNKPLKTATSNRKSVTEPIRRSWVSTVFGLETVMSFREFLEARPIPLPEGRQIPNAIFARKFGLLADSQPIPPALSLISMPTAEIKATELVTEAVANGSVSPAWSYRGPFTPQLGFDGGLDFRWCTREPVLSSSVELSNGIGFLPEYQSSNCSATFKRNNNRGTASPRSGDRKRHA